MDPANGQYQEPDSWEQVADSGPANTEAPLQIQKPFSSLNINAPDFVPSWLTKTSPSQEQQPDAASPTAGSTDNAMDAETAAGGDTQEPMDDPEPPPAEPKPGTLDDMAAANGELGEEEEEGEPMEEEEEEDEEEEAAKATAAVKKKTQEPTEPSAPLKEHINVIFIGHVDAGKSTIGGQIMYLTGMVDKRTLEKYEREAKEKNRETWYLSWALDTNLEEREKGKTVEVGRAYFETERRHFTILDAPGHKSFVPNMICGASQADIAILVISARRGEFETGFERGGQTREHAMLVKTAGVKHIVVVINKMDDPTVEWSQARYEECKEKLIPFLKKVGFNPKKDLYFIPVSGYTGANLKIPDREICPWYSGPPLIQYLDELQSIDRRVDGPIRVPITDRYKDMGTVALGKLESGTLARGMQLVLMPNKTSVEILALQSDENEVESAIPGENLKLRLKGIEEEDIIPGFVLCSPENVCNTGRIFDAQVVILEHKSIICAGYSCVMHCHACVEEVQFKLLLALVDRKTGKVDKTKPRPRFIKQDNIVIARLETTGVICIETFKDFPQMGRFTLRDEGKTIAVGKVLKLLE
ncbi:PREDICTED: LOW QUALITY PROTEIN: eukaryotic peptide chain release factor GTP-binding subunit ERF3A-like [Branchiostoma belcheri]|uniref:LOW QUALITY PROTEIN: eukaryotic peptide chain release factor GTP-binding subunit ERF3A-like n=1 Tax=Branchiostoma belcheri TaxID=7741 RepID=A0A6P4YA32_BRABE|nr:PREDICTED: LOW QUALITY PROTEIN: eukaryotic peptide chain release factor GTP-binding subunit ERF3A-like [Branchiostoma belcheri]